MIIGELLREVFAGQDFSYTSPWFARRGDQVVCSCNAIAVSSSKLRFTVEVWTKDSDETDLQAGFVASSSTISARGVASLTASGLRQLLRYHYFVTSSPLTGTEWVHFEMMDPAWLLDGTG
jgi:hypothetical protein